MNILVTLVLTAILTWPVAVRAALEIEPNNSLGQATLVDPRQPIEGRINDPVDVYKVVLASDGRVDVRLQGYPAGTRVRAEILGFAESDNEKLAARDNHGHPRLALTFAAQERSGFIRLQFEQENRCERGWCAIRLAPEGPWYTVSRGLDPVPDWLHEPLLEPPGYRLTLNQPREQTGSDTGRGPSIPPDYLTFADDASGLAFRYPPTWKVAAGSEPRSWRLAPRQTTGPAMHIELKLVPRIEVPGSSAQKQLNLLEKFFSDQGADIRKRGQMEVAGKQVPYLVLLQPGSGGPEARLQLVIPLPDHYLQAGYAGPQKHYPDALGIFENLLQSITVSLKP